MKSTPDGWLGRAAGALTADGATPFRSVRPGRDGCRACCAATPARSRSPRWSASTCGAASQPAVSQRGFESLYREGGRDLLHGTGRETFEAVKMLKSAARRA